MPTTWTQLAVFAGSIVGIFLFLTLLRTVFLLVVYQMDANAKLRFAELKNAKALVAKAMEKQKAKRNGNQSRPNKTPPTEDKKKR
jgi:hypothetical protein